MTSSVSPRAQCGTDESDIHDKPSSACLAIQYVLAKGAYAPFVRDHVVQAQYFKVRSPRATVVSEKFRPNWQL